MATYTVTYNGNGSTGGSVPVDGSSPYSTGATVTVLGNTGTLVKTGFVFAGWNLLANGSSTSYVVGNTFTMGTANVILYALWYADGTAVPYNPSGTDASGNRISGLRYFGGSPASTLTSVDGAYPGIKSYWMRGWNSSTSLYVNWQAPMIDYNAVFAPVQVSGTLTDIVWLGYTYKGL